MAVKVFVSYSHADDELRSQLEEHLAQLHREGHVEAWTDRRIPPGDAWGTAIDEALETADVVLLLVSSAFLASEYCNDVELEQGSDLAVHLLGPLAGRAAFDEGPESLPLLELELGLEHADTQMV